MKSSKKAKKTGAKKSPAKTAAGKQKRNGNPVAAALEKMDPAYIELMRQVLETALGSDDDEDDPGEGANALLQAYIAGSRDDAMSDDEHNDLLVAMGEALDELRVSANGGDREAREELREVFETLDEALDGGKIHPVDLMILAKVLTEAGLPVPDTLKSAVRNGMESSAPSGADGSDLVSSLLGLVAAVDENAFDLHSQLNSVFASLPTEIVAELVGTNLAGRSPIVDQALAGFALHADAELASAAMRALAARAAQEPTPSLMIERLVRMRAWTPPKRQGEIDAAVRAMRQNALPPVKVEQAKIMSCLTSVRDGSGGASLFATLRGGGKNHIASVMTKVFGVAETILLRELPKSKLDDFSRALKSSLPTGTNDLDGVAALLRLALADNVASGVLPPFSLVEIAEALGLGPLHPDFATTAELIDRILGVAPDLGPPASVAGESVYVLNLVGDSWFEAGEAVEDLLYPIKGHAKRVARLMNDYLPGRREFWARQCAISALALRGVGAEPSPDAARLATIGRALVAGLPYAQISLMRGIAEQTVAAFQSRE